MPAVLADTQALVWYLAERTRLSPAARRALDATNEEGFAVYISAVSLVELVHPVEKGEPSRRATEESRRAARMHAGGPMRSAVAQNPPNAPSAALPTT